MNPRRRVLTKTLVGASAAFATIRAPLVRAADAWPNRPVRIVYPYPPGGTGDAILRPIGTALSSLWGQPVVVDNRPGAGGMIGAESVAKAAPDGYTLLFALTGLIQMPVLYGKAPFDPIRDFTPICEIGTSHWALVAQPELPVSDVAGFLAYAARQPRPLPYGTYSIGSSAHLQMEALARQTKAPLVHVPYKGEAPLVQDLLGQQIPTGTVAAVTARRHAGKLRAIAVAGATRAPLLPDVPTFAESGHAGLERQGFAGFLAPAGTPAEIVEKVAADVGTAIADPAFRTRMNDLGFILRNTPTSAFAEFLRLEQQYWIQVTRDTGVRLTQ